jgi:hypothetical protein
MHPQSILKKEYRNESKERPWGKFLRPFLGLKLKVRHWLRSDLKNSKRSILEVFLRSNLGVFTFAFIIILYSSFIILVPQAHAATLSKPPSNLGLVGYWSFNEGTSTVATDFSGSGKNGTTTNMANPASATSGWTTKGKRGNALNFDGVNDYVGKGSVQNLTTNFTVAGWIKRTETFSNGDYRMWYSNGLDGGDGWAVYVQNNAGTYNHYFLKGIVVAIDSGISSTQSDWEYVVWTVDGSARPSLWINGTSVFSSSDSQAINTPSGSTYIGANQLPLNTASRFWPGGIDEVRIYNRALSPSEITALYKSGAVSHKVPNNLGLVGYWSMNEGTSTTITDFSGNGNNGVLKTDNPPLVTNWANGKFGKALDFDSVTLWNWVDAGTNVPLDSSNWTISTWVKWDKGNNGYQRMLAYYGDGPTIWKDTAVAALSIVHSGAIDFNMNINLVQDTWQHIVVARAGSTITAYLNGVQTAQNTSFAITYTNVGSVSLGKSSTFGEHFGGVLDEVRLYNRGLTADEVTGLYQGSKAIFANMSPVTKITNGLVGYWTFDGKDTAWNTNQTYDRSGNNNTGTMTNMSTSSSPVIGKLGQALKFDGVDGVVDSGSPASLDDLGPLTFSAWIKPNSTGEGGGGVIVSKANAPGDLRFNFESTGTNALSFSKNYDGGTDLKRTTSNNFITLGVWSHITVTWDGSATAANVHIYVNGVETTYQTTTDGVGNKNSDATLNFYIGNLSGSFHTFDGTIDEVRIYNRALSDSEIKQLYLMGK